ncbi:nucleotidyltransferase domain-containing protein [Lentisphaera marina]|nr:nucleotidyltransferase domain-containing protein [Lentisphaera marina]MDD7984258.1 nucleotidyltransferase domain-containing protein [Lentisphaera marina]
MKIIEELKKELPEVCEKYDIAFVDLFGSIARDEGTESSDLDLIIDFQEPKSRHASKRYFGFLHSIEDKFGKNVDLLTPKSLSNPFLLNEVNKDRIRLYGK